MELGRVVGAHGLAGQVRVRIFGDGPGNLFNCEEVWLGESRDDPHAKAYKVHYGGTGRAKEARLGIEGIRDRDAAHALKGQLVLGNVAALEPLAADEFYWHQLVGCRVETETGELVGTVREIWETGAHDVLVVKDENGRQNLVPTARELAHEIDLEARRIVVTALPGLLDLGSGDEADEASQDDSAPKSDPEA
ncbi:MAG: 16S rRNA processing protein RimM [Myxococcota bacterium]